MKKTLRIIALCAGLISTLATIMLGCIYLEDLIKYIKNLKIKFINPINSIKAAEEIDDDEF